MNLSRVTRFFVGILILVFLLPGGHIEARRHPGGKRSKSAQRSTARIRKQRGQSESQLAKLQSEIARYQIQLAEHEKQAKRSQRNLSAFNRRTSELKQAIARLEAQVESLTEKKSEVDESIQQTASTLSDLKSSYAASVRLLYMQGKLTKQDPDRFLFSPEKNADNIRESYYAHVIGEAHAMNRDRLDSMKRSLSAEGTVISNTLSHSVEQIGRQSEEANSIEAQRALEARRLETLQQDKDRLRKLIAERQRSAKRLEGIIANLLAKEEAARKTARSRSRKKESSRRTPRHGRAPVEEEEEPNIGPAYGPHSLAWPSATHRVKQGYGEHRNQTLNTVTVNLGIDIAAPEGSAVLAAAEGQVSLVSTLPSYGTIIVIQHAGGLHTVYADLSGANVRAGAHVRTGQAIGRSGSNEESGALLHFEVWKGKSKQNPMGWLR